MTEPTQEQIRAARRQGFQKALSGAPADKRAKLVASYEKQDTRREANINLLVSKLTTRRK